MLVVGVITAASPLLAEVEGALIAIFTVIFTVVSGVVIAVIAGEDINLVELGLKDLKDIGKIGAWPIVGPIVDLLTSRKAMVWVATIVVDYLVLVVPALEQAQPDLVTVFVTLLGGLTAALFGANYFERKAEAVYL